MEGLKEVVLKLWHPGCWSIEITRNHPGVYLIVTGVFKISDEIRANFKLVAENYDALSSFIKDMYSYGDLAKELTVISRKKLIVYIHGRFTPKSTFYENIFGLDIMPTRIVIHNGHEYWTVLVYEEKLGEALKKLEGVENIDLEVLSIANLGDAKEEFDDIIDQLLSELSMKQKKVLFEAYRSGYFEWPRKVNLKELSEKFGIAKSTCLHHIRSAEQKILKKFLEELWERERYLED
ncbi:helix-turn-helix domain-containing protein [Archaeoglobus neptunius]|uniref:helix-turn-helix domain-containing protein n=1 Tax=Archaeoglobus neptunius TaxID=2798580 RepID=UPI00192591B0|nr:helix-turn-helix domain-containing protein [Archaeoglobus neptunius]